MPRRSFFFPSTLGILDWYVRPSLFQDAVCPHRHGHCRPSGACRGKPFFKKPRDAKDRLAGHPARRSRGCPSENEPATLDV